MHAGRVVVLGAAAAAFVAAIVSPGCRRGPAIEARPFDPAAAAAAAISACDADGSGGIGAAELEACPGLAAAAGRIDADGDGTLTQAEMAARFAVYKAAAGMVVPLKYRVTLDGRPLAGAAVTLAPESFMGPSWASGSGTTGNDGDVVVSADAVRAKGFAGVYPGIYRITVAPAGGDPAKPLTHAATGTTELGQDVAPDNRDLELPRQLAMTTRRGKPAAK